MLFMLIALTSDADYEGKLRPQCYWWRAKYWAEAILNNSNTILRGREKNCHGVLDSEKQKRTCTYGLDSAYAIAWAFPPPYYFGGIGRAVHNSCLNWYAGRDVLYEKSKFKNLPLVTSKNTEEGVAYEESNIQATEVTFDTENNRVILTGLTGYLIVENEEDIGNGYSVAVLRIQEALADSLIDSLESDIIWEGKVILANGSLSFSGNFSTLNLVVTTTNLTYGKKIEFYASTFTIQLPENTDMDNIEAEISGDCGLVENGISSEYISTNDKIKLPESDRFNFSIYPNPTNKFIDIKVENIDYKKINKIFICNFQGQFIKEIKKGVTIKNRDVIRINLDNLPTGVYFLGLEINNKNYYRKLMLE